MKSFNIFTILLFGSNFVNLGEARKDISLGQNPCQRIHGGETLFSCTTATLVNSRQVKLTGVSFNPGNRKIQFIVTRDNRNIYSKPHAKGITNSFSFHYDGKCDLPSLSGDITLTIPKGWTLCYFLGIALHDWDNIQNFGFINFGAAAISGYHLDDLDDYNGNEGGSICRKIAQANNEDMIKKICHGLGRGGGGGGVDGGKGNKNTTGEDGGVGMIYANCNLILILFFALLFFSKAE